MMKVNTLSKSILAQLFCCATLLFCVLSTTAEVSAQPDAFQGYKMMRIPRGEVAVGAVWQQGLGVDADGAPKEALQVNQAPSSMVGSQQFRASAEFSILQWLGLTGSLGSTAKINLTDVQLVTVKDISTLQIQPGNQVIYEAVKVGAFNVVTESSSQAMVKAALAQRSLNVKVEGGNSLAVTGSNLFVAYRVITLGTPKVMLRKKLTLRAEREYLLGPYRMNFRTGGFINCMCQKENLSEHQRVHECEKINPVLMVAQSETRSEFIGQMMRKEFSVRLHDDGKPERPTLLFMAKQAGFIEVDTVTLRAKVVSSPGSVKQPDGSWKCALFSDDRFQPGSEIELVTIRYPFKPFPHPSAPGW